MYTSQKTVMVVDDQVSIRKMIKEFLLITGYEPFEASDGMEALDLAVREKPDIALVDINLPGIDGISLFRCMKKICPELMAIFMSGSSDIWTIKRANEEGVVDFLIKPFDILELLDILNNCSASRIASRGEKNGIRCKI
ncbi:MAG: response regulator [Thermoanaerobacterales bacterium]|jgi:two-component system response regulator (stage 0 sporulation protein F)|nr:response regulator [Thermoanaerobacterales bacterium]